MDIGILTTVYDARDDQHRAVTDRVLNRERQATRDIDRELKQRQANAERAADAVLRQLPGGSQLTQFKGLAEDMGLVGTAALGAVAGVAVLTTAVIALGTGLFELTKAEAEYGAHLHDLSIETGATTKTLSAFALGAELAGSSLDKARPSLDLYLKNLSEAAHGNTTAAKSFERFGIDAKTAIKNPDQAIQDLLSRLAKIPNEAERLDAAYKLAGRSGAILARIAGEMGGSFADLQRKAEELGVSFSEQDARHAKEFEVALTLLEARAKGIGYTVSKEVGPEITKAIDDIASALGANLVSWESWGLGIAIEIARVRGAAEGLAKWMHGDTWSPRQLGRDVQQSADDAEVGAVTDFALRKFNQEKERPGRGAGGIGDVRGKGGESAARKAARQALELAQIDIRAAESIYKEGADIEKRAYDLGTETFSEYVQKRKDLEKERYEAIKKGFEAERRAAATLPTAGERNVKLADIQEKEQAALREYNSKRAQLTTEGLLHDLETKRKFAEESIRLGEQMNSNEIAEQKQQAETGLRIYQEIEDRRFQLQQQIFAQRQRLINEDLKRYEKGDADKLKIAQQADDALTEEIRSAGLEHGQLSRDARQRDLDNAQRYAQSLRAIYAEVSNVNAQVRQSQINAMPSQMFDPGDAQREAQLVLDRALETARSARARADLQERLRQTANIRDPHESANTQRALNRQIEAEERLHVQNMADIDRKAAEDKRRDAVQLADDIAGVLGAGLQSFQGRWSDLWRGMLQEALNVLRQIAAEILKMSLESLMGQQPRGMSGGGLLATLVNAIGGHLFGAAIGGTSLAPWGARSPGNPFAGLGHATGGVASGWSVVGEQGPELAFFGNPAQIFSNQDSQRMLGSQRAGNTYNIVMPRQQQRSYVQRRATREGAEMVMGIISTRTKN